jgi:hypothetical protein
MKGILVQTTLYGDRDLNRILRTKRLRGHSKKAIGYQLPSFKDRALSYCSYFCKGYNQVYGNREGVAFETESPIVYTCPADNFHLLRGGNWLPGHERFIFPTIEEMLEKYPMPEYFKKDFVEFFSKLKPEEVYPDCEPNFAREQYESDYCFDSKGTFGCNEVTFDKPTIIKPIGIFRSVEELMGMIE